MNDVEYKLKRCGIDLRNNWTSFSGYCILTNMSIYSPKWVIAVGLKVIVVRLQKLVIISKFP